MTSKERGNRSEGAVIAEMIKRGYPVSIPFGENQPYDFIFEENGQLFKAQVKTCTFDGLVVYCDTRNNRGSKFERRYEGVRIVDFFFIYVPVLDKVYKIAHKDFLGQRAITLRVAAHSAHGGPRNMTTRWAVDYELKP